MNSLLIIDDVKFQSYESQALGLKEAIVSNEIYLQPILNAFRDGSEEADQATIERVTRIAESINSVLDFDSIMVTGLNAFDSVSDYYRDLTASDEQIVNNPHNKGHSSFPLEYSGREKERECGHREGGWGRG